MVVKHYFYIINMRATVNSIKPYKGILSLQDFHCVWPYPAFLAESIQHKGIMPPPVIKCPFYSGASLLPVLARFLRNVFPESFSLVRYTNTPGL
jgi:hypothetical protein